MFNRKLIQRFCAAALLLCAWSSVAAAQTLFSYPSSVGVPTSGKGLIAGPDGNMWFIIESGGIGKITPDGTATKYATGLSPAANPGVILSAPDGNLWFSEPGISGIGRITTAGTITEYQIGTQIAGMTIGPDGNIWFTNNSDANYVGRFALDGSLTVTLYEVESPIPLGLGPITAGADGNLWIVANTVPAIGKVSTQGKLLTYYPLSSEVGDITLGPDGAVWFAYPQAVARITTNGSVTQYPLSKSSGSVGDITVGPDGNLWFFEIGPNQIARITPQGAITEYLDYAPETMIGESPPTYASNIAVGPNNTIWFGVQAYPSPAINKLALSQPSQIAAAVLPGGRAVLPGATATVFATMINGGTNSLNNCQVALTGAAPSGLQLSYQATDPATNLPIGQPNQPVTIPGGNSAQSFVLSFQSTVADGLMAPATPLNFACDGAVAATFPRIDTVDLTFIDPYVLFPNDYIVPDYILQIASETPGVLTVPVNGAAAFAVAMTNLGGEGIATDIHLDTGIAILPISATFCETDPTTGVCLKPPVTDLQTLFPAGAAATFAVFVTATGSVPLAPDINRVYVDFDTFPGQAFSRASTSIAIEAH